MWVLLTQFQLDAILNSACDFVMVRQDAIKEYTL